MIRLCESSYIEGLYKDNGKQNGNYYDIIGFSGLWSPLSIAMCFLPKPISWQVESDLSAPAGDAGKAMHPDVCLPEPGVRG